MAALPLGAYPARVPSGHTLPVRLLYGNLLVPNRPRPRSGPPPVGSHDGRPAQLAVLDASPNAIVAVDDRGRISYVNPRAAETFGYGADELLGSSVDNLVPEHAAGRHAGHRAVFTAQPVARPMGNGLELAGRRKDGTEFPVEIGLAPVHTPDGPLVFATIVDITARKAAEAQLLQAQKLESIGRLAGGIAHDFNNMLFAIRGYAEMLEDDLAPERAASLDATTARQYAASIGTVVERATLLTTQLLAFGRRGRVSPLVLDIDAAVTGLVPMLQRLIGDTVELVLSLDPVAGQVQVDPGQLDQILVNLVVNARDAMPGGGRITIATGNAEFDAPYAQEHFGVEAGPYVMLAVSDTGHGMDRETRAHVFEPFFTTKEPGRGTGLGLATIYGIVRQADGHIWLYSEPGRGTTFKLYLPRVDTPAADEPAPYPSGAPSRGTVLVVEDEPTVLEMTLQVLRRAGWEPTAVSSGEEALTLVDTRAQPFDAIVSDVVMTGLSGIELAERVLDRLPGSRIVLLSGYTADTLDLARVEGRGVHFVPKPLSARQLLDALGDAGSMRETRAAPAPGPAGGG